MGSRTPAEDVVFAVRRLWRLIPASVRARVWARFGYIVPYQKVIYRGRVLSGGTDRTETYKLLFPTPPAGKTVLDIGCHLGFYCFQASSDGARYCLGIDIDERRVAKARRLARQNKIANLDFIAGDINEFAIQKPFDIILCLNVLQHMKSIAAIDGLIDRLQQSAAERLLLILPITNETDEDYRCEIRNRIPYLVPSRRFFESKFGTGAAVLDLPPSCYGPDRAMIVINGKATRQPQVLLPGA